jgi:hypothetical protein
LYMDFMEVMYTMYRLLFCDSAARCAYGNYWTMVVVTNEPPKMSLYIS